LKLRRIHACAMCFVVAFALQGATHADGDVAATAARGIAGEVTFVYDGLPISVRANQTLTSSMLVRLSRVAPEGEVPARYRLAFLGGVAGEFDLREHLEHGDGHPIDDLPPLRVRIFSQLPAQPGTDLFSGDSPQFALTSRYRLVLGGVAAIWLLVPVTVVARRMLRRTPPEAAPVAAPVATVADQLRPLIEAARGDGLSVSEQGRLELLLLMFWRERLGMTELRPAESIRRLREDPEAGRLLGAVERWLHARGRAAPQPETDVAALLEPYASTPAMTSLAGARQP